MRPKLTPSLIVCSLFSQALCPRRVWEELLTNVFSMIGHGVCVYLIQKLHDRGQICLFYGALQRPWKSHLMFGFVRSFSDSPSTGSFTPAAQAASEWRTLPWPRWKNAVYAQHGDFNSIMCYNFSAHSAGSLHVLCTVQSWFFCDPHMCFVT